MKVEIFTTVHRPIDEVFDFLTNHANEPRWNEDLDDVIGYDHDNWGVGSTCEMIFESGASVPITVTDFVRDKVYGFRSADASSRYELADKGDHTQIRFVTEVQLQGLMVRTLMRSSIHRNIEDKLEANFANLKQIMERPVG